MKNVPFTFDGNVHQQRAVVAMGSSLGSSTGRIHCPQAMISFLFLEKCVLHTWTFVKAESIEYVLQQIN